MKIQDYLQTHNLLVDGAFGTYYAEKYRTQNIPELENIGHPEQIQAVHADYLAAGATMIRTNTFIANTVALQKDWDTVAAQIQAAIQCAKLAVEPYQNSEPPRFIAGDIGPIPTDSSLNPEEAEAEYLKIAKLFLENGISILNFETFPDMEQLASILPKIKADFDCFLIVSFTVNQFGYSASGLSAKRLLQDAQQNTCIDAVGLNCGVGPRHMYQILERLELPRRLHFMALPNAGYPTVARNRLQFNHTASYFAEHTKKILSLGVDMIGGCCGTNPTCIQRVAETGMLSHKKPLPSSEQTAEQAPKRVPCGFLYDENGMRKKKKIIAVELVPPFNADDEKLLESAHYLKLQNVDVLTFPDSPSGRTRVDSVLMAEKVRRATGLEVMPHICCRDKNALAMRSILMGAQINDIQNMLIITGDPIPSMARQTIKAVFHFDSVGLMNIIKEMNEETFAQHPLLYGGAINQSRKNLDSILHRVKKKQEAGASFFLSQPVFTKEDADRLRFIQSETGATILCGIMPLVSRKNALFMKNEIAGINVSDTIIERYPEQATREEGEAVGIALAKEIIAMVDDFADGYYFSFPFNRVYLLPKILSKDPQTGTE